MKRQNETNRLTLFLYMKKNELLTAKETMSVKIEELKKEGFSYKMAFIKGSEWFESTYGMQAPYRSEPVYANVMRSKIKKKV